MYLTIIIADILYRVTYHSSCLDSLSWHHCIDKLLDFGIEMHLLNTKYSKLIWMVVKYKTMFLFLLILPIQVVQCRRYFKRSTV